MPGISMHLQVVKQEIDNKAVMGSVNCGSLFPCKDQFSAFNFYTSNM